VEKVQPLRFRDQESKGSKQGPLCGNLIKPYGEEKMIRVLLMTSEKMAKTL